MQELLVTDPQMGEPVPEALLVTDLQMGEPVPEAFPAVVSHDLQTTVAPPEEAPIVQAEEIVIVEGLQPVQNQQPPTDYASVASIPQTSDPIPLQVRLFKRTIRMLLGPLFLSHARQGKQSYRNSQRIAIRTKVHR